MSFVSPLLYLHFRLL